MKKKIVKPKNKKTGKVKIAVQKKPVKKLSKKTIKLILEKLKEVRY